MYIYECHMGGLYATDYELEYEYLYCEQCGDSDWLLGYVETKEAARCLLKDNGWDWEYIQKFIDTYWDDEE